MIQDEVKFSRTQKFLTTLPPAIFILANISLFGPLTIYHGNVAEIGYPFLSIVKSFIYPTLIAISILSLIGAILSDRLHQRYIASLFMFGILIWLQGNIIVWKYGVFDGRSIDWSVDEWRGWVDGALWILLLGASVIFYKSIYTIARSGSIAIFCLQLILAGYTGLTKPEIWKTDFPEPGVTPKWAADFSTNRNVIQLILDGVESDIFQAIVNEKPEYYSNTFEGFTFFKEATGHFQSTHFSVPAIVSGQLYKNDVPMGEFLEKTYNGNTTINALHQQGYEVDLVPWSSLVPRAQADNYYAIPSPYAGSLSDFVRSKTTLLLDLVLFRHAPHVLKRVIYNDQKWLTQRSGVENEKLQFRRFGDEAFLQDITNELSATRDKPVYKLYHLESSHPPFVTDSNCQYAGKVLPITRMNIATQIRCTLGSVVAFLEKLKSAGIYDKALIIVQADRRVCGSTSPERKQWTGGGV